MERFTATDDKGMLSTMTIRKRPAFALAWTKFKYIFGDGDVIGVGEKIGGKIKFNIDLGASDPNLGFTNACAIRMSYVFNQAGLTVPYMEGKVSSGENGGWYIFGFVIWSRLFQKKWGLQTKFLSCRILPTSKTRKALSFSR